MSTLNMHTDVLHRNGEVRLRGTVLNEAGNVIFVDTINAASSRSRKQFAKRTAEKLGDAADVDEIDRRLLAACEPADGPGGEENDETVAAASVSADLLADMPQAVRDEAAEMLASPRLVERIKEDIERLGLKGDARVAFTLYLVSISRLLDKPLAAIVCGATSSGKSYAINKVASLIPVEAKVLAHRMTPKALYYMEDGALIHRFVVGGERSKNQNDESADATKALREMLSDGVLRCAVTENVEGKFQTSYREQHGPIAYVESTSAASIFPEDENRCLILHTDESREQTRAILIATANAAATTHGSAHADAIVLRHHAMQRMLRQVIVQVPFAPLLAERFPVTKVEARRAFTHLLSTIRAVALLRQFQKQPDAPTIFADAADYEVALDVMRPTLSRLHGEMSEAAERLLEAIRERSGKGQIFGRNDAAVWAGVRESDAGPRLRLLAEQDFLIEVESHRGNRPAKYRLNAHPPDPLEQAARELPMVDEVAAFMRDGGGE